jgi:adenosylhomocysteine nucleosidase
VLALETGIGAKRTEQALTWLLSRPLLGNLPYRPKLVLSAGFSGALHESLAVGDVVLAGDVVDEQGNRWPATWPGELPSGEWRPALHRGRVVTAAHPVGRPDEKAELGRRHQALAVDMETAVIARLCTVHDVPFGCVRAISDDVRTALSGQVLALLSAGHAWPLALLKTLTTTPRTAAELWRLARNTRLAAHQLGLALGELLTLTLPWTPNNHR